MIFLGRFALLFSIVSLVSCIEVPPKAMKTTPSKTITNNQVENSSNASDEIEPIQLSEKDNNKTINISKGQELLIALESNPSTGYQWFTQQSNQLLHKISTFYKSSTEQPDQVGLSGKKELLFKATKAGTTELKLLYSREQRSIPAREVRYKILINN